MSSESGLFARRIILPAIMTSAMLRACWTAKAGQEYDMETVQAAKVLTDGYIDTTSIEGIVNGLAKEGMSDQEKVIAFYDWFRRIMFHHRNMGGDVHRRDLLRSINSCGYNLCGSQAAVLAMILQKAGFKTRVVCGEAGKGFGGHTFLEVNYGGKWHCIDTMTSFFVYNRDTPPSIAGLEEMQADPSLVADSLKENRAPPGFLYCMHSPEITTNDISRIENMGIKADRRWATFTFEGGSLFDYWKKGSRQWRVLDTGTYGGRYEPGVLDITLKPNEEYVRLWDNVGKWVAGFSYEAVEPHHTCGHVDEADPVNFKFYEPYKKEHFGLTKVCYRYYANGWLEWKPENAAEVRAAAKKIENLAAEGAYLKPEDPAREGLLSIPVKSPYAIVQIELGIVFQGPECPSVTLVIKDKTCPFKPTNVADQVAIFQYDEKNAPFYRYDCEIKAKAGVRFRLNSLKTVFQHNMYVLPGFFPGRNKVTVSAKTPQRLTRSQLVVTYKWREGSNWTLNRENSRPIASFPTEYEIDVAGPKMPRMLSLSLKLARK